VWAKSPTGASDFCTDYRALSIREFGVFQGAFQFGIAKFLDRQVYSLGSFDLARRRFPTFLKLMGQTPLIGPQLFQHLLRRPFLLLANKLLGPLRLV